MKTQQIEKEIYSTFAEIACNIGYSEIHGRIIGALLVKGKPLSLQELSKEIGYSISTVSPSLDLLEFLGMIKKVKRVNDRNLYIQLEGDLLDGLKKAFLIRIQKSVNNSLDKFKLYRNEVKKSGNGNKKEMLRAINVLEKDVKRVNRYITILSKLRLS